MYLYRRDAYTQRGKSNYFASGIEVRARRQDTRENTEARAQTYMVIQFKHRLGIKSDLCV